MNEKTVLFFCTAIRLLAFEKRLFLERIMLISIACLTGSPDNMARARVFGIMKNIEVKNQNDVLKAITKLYRHPKSPFPCIGTVRAGIDGIVAPANCDTFMWITVNEGGNVILDDFGSGDRTNRMDNFNRICQIAMKRCQSIWKFSEMWTLSHHKTSIEALVRNYVNFVTMTQPRSSYLSWLGASGAFTRAPFHSSEELYYVGIDMSSIDNTQSVKAVLEDAFFREFVKKHDNSLEIQGGAFISRFLESRRIHAEAKINSSRTFDERRMESLKKEMIHSWLRR